jgi:hypothetical protein
MERDIEFTDRLLDRATVPYAELQLLIGLGFAAKDADARKAASIMDMWSGHQPFAVDMLRQLYGTRPQPRPPQPQQSSPPTPPQLDPTLVQDTASKLFAGLCAAGANGMSQRNILRKLFHSHIRAYRLDAALQKLLAARKVRYEVHRRGNGPGRPSTVWFAVG